MHLRNGVPAPAACPAPRLEAPAADATGGETRLDRRQAPVPEADEERFAKRHEAVRPAARIDSGTRQAAPGRWRRPAREAARGGQTGGGHPLGHAARQRPSRRRTHGARNRLAQGGPIGGEHRLGQAPSQARPPRKAHHPPPGGKGQSSHPERAARSPAVPAATTEPDTPLDSIGARSAPRHIRRGGLTARLRPLHRPRGRPAAPRTARPNSPARRARSGRRSAGCP